MELAGITVLEKKSPEKAKYEARHKKIVETYGGDLPTGLDQLKTVLVVPSLAELSNNNFWRLLRSLGTQIGTDQKTFATLLVINNSQQAVVNQNPGSIYEGNSPSMVHERFQENQKHLKIVREINRLQADAANATDIKESLDILRQEVEISDWEAQVFETAITRGVQVYAVDCSSDGRAFAANPDGTRNNPIGRARDIGGHLADELLKAGKSKENGIIDFLDGDCFVSPEYFQDLQDIATRHPGRPVIKPMVTQQVEIPEKVYKIENPEKRFAALVAYLTTSITHMRQKYWDMGRRHSEVLGGPQLAVPVKMFRDVNGYPHRGSNEDFAFSRTIAEQKTQKETARKAMVYLSDRGREGSTDGSGRGEALNRSVDRQDIVTVVRNEVQHRMSVTMALLLQQNRELESGKRSKEYLKLRHQEFRLESLKRKFFIQTTEKLIPIICDTITKLPKGEFTPAQVVEAIPELNSRYKDFLLGNLALVDMLITAGQIVEESKEFQIRSVGASVEGLKTTMIRGLVARCLPEYFSPPPSTEPNYNVDSSSVLSQGGVARDYIHIASAAFKFHSKYQRPFEFSDLFPGTT